MRPGRGSQVRLAGSWRGKTETRAGAGNPQVDEAPRMWVCAGIALLLLAVPVPLARGQVDGPELMESWLDVEVPPKPEPSDALLASGREIFDFRCAPCHGVQGDGKGPVAPTLDPRPRDLVQAFHRFRTTVTGELPTDEDLFRTITRGIPGTAMPSWSFLPAEDRWALVAQVKQFGSELFDDEGYDPYRIEDGEGFIVPIGNPPEATPERIAEGKKIFVDAGCVQCHGERGYGNTEVAKKQFDNFQRRTWPRDLTKGWRFKAGSTTRDIFKTFTVGLTGLPMPSYQNALDPADPAKDESMRWSLALYVRTLVEGGQSHVATVLRVPRSSGPIPLDPADPAWDKAPAIDVPLAGQGTFRPRWQLAAIDRVTLRALHDGETVAFHLTYHDRTKSEVHEVLAPSEDTSAWPEVDVSALEFTRVHYRDAVALEFPLRPVTGIERPYFLYGSSSSPVELWRFEADRQKASGDGTGAVEELEARGPARLTPRPEAAQEVEGAGRYFDGEWKVVLRRALHPGDPARQALFKTRAWIPLVLMAWDGGNGEVGLRHSVSSWIHVYLEAPLGTGILRRAAWSALVFLLLEVLLVRGLRRSVAPEEDGPRITPRRPGS